MVALKPQPSAFSFLIPSYMLDCVRCVTHSTIIIVDVVVHSNFFFLVLFFPRHVYPILSEIMFLFHLILQATSAF